MGAFFRSEPMCLAQLFIQTESACLIVYELGKLGVCQFNDLNFELSAFQRKFVNIVRRCNRVEDNLKSLENEIKKAGITVRSHVDNLDMMTLSELMDLEITVADTEEEVTRLIHCYDDLRSTYFTLVELENALKVGRTIIDQVYSIQESDNSDAIDHGDFEYITGVINRQRFDAFERIVWRLSKGNAYVQSKQIPTLIRDAQTGEKVAKDVFLIFYKGESLHNKIYKLCEGYKVSLHPCPKSKEERNQILETVSTRVSDIKLIIQQSKSVLDDYLALIANEVPKWGANIRRIKAVYHTINGFHCKVGGSYLIGECWLPKRDVKRVQDTLVECKEATGSFIDSFINIIETNRLPPTLHKTNKFTLVFQNIIHAYGVSSYEEANPALFTIISFPFLFGVMFGDIGHAIIMIMFAAFLIIREKDLIAQNIQSEIFNNFFNGRYLILLMGLFSFYAGLIYNECFAKSLNMFGTTWKVNLNATDLLEMNEYGLDPITDHSHAYPLGVDPVWEIAEKNKIIFQNSIKMKVSVILGVTHMIFGVCVSITNHIHFRRYEKIVVEFLPKLLLLCSVFLWLIFMIFIKWVIYSAKSKNVNYGTSCAPSLLIFFIDMMLMQRTKSMVPGCQSYMFPLQPSLQKILFIIYFACIPWMLFGKMIYKCFQACCRKLCCRKNKDVSTVESLRSNSEEEHEEEESFVYDAIHTIEFVLGTVSHTASYLRLWALSLAHSQLSEVLWNNILRNALAMCTSYEYGLVLFLGFGIWMFFTIAILIVMEGLSAFLHTLRLHWVEFMSKFYRGDGYLFHPFDLRNILEEEFDVNY